MRLGASEYAQGLVSWNPIPGLHVRLGRRAADGSLEMSERLPDSSGSLCPFTDQVLTPRFDVTTNAPITTREIWVRIERVVKGVVVTTYAHGLGQLHATLKHVPDYGTYHRLVIDAGELDWDEDLVLA